MEKEKLALAIACMTMFAMEQSDEDNSENSKKNSELHKIKKEIAENFPALSIPVSELYMHNRKEKQKEINQSEEV